MSYYDIYKKDYQKKKKNLKTVVTLFVICVVVLALIILFSSGKDQSEQWKIGDKTGSRQNQAITNTETAGPSAQTPEQNQSSTATFENEAPSSALSMDEKVKQANLVKFDRLIQNFIKVDLNRAKKSFTTFATGCTTSDLIASITEGSGQQSSSVHDLWDGSLWYDFFNTLYMDIRDNRIYFGSTPTAAKNQQQTVVSRPAHCRETLISIAGSFVFVKDKFVSKIEQGNRLGLYPAEVQETIDRYNLDLTVMEELSVILANIKIELE